MKSRKNLYPWIAAFVILAFTVYVILDTFVLSSELTPEETTGRSREEALLTMAVSQSKTETTGSETETAEDSETDTEEQTATTEDVSVNTEPVITDTSYSDENISITISSFREFDSDIYVADIQLGSSEYLKTALAGNSYGKNIKATTSDTAEENNAILAVNGDYYGARETGYCVRGGVLYRSSATTDADALAILADGTFKIVDENEVTCQELIDMGAWDVFSFGPGLVSDGEIIVPEDYEIGSYQHNNPRTAIGQVGDLHYIFVVVDGRTSESYGVTCYELAEIMLELGCEQAYNLDGGGSSVMVFNGTEVNNPTADGKEFKERKVTDIVYIGY